MKHYKTWVTSRSRYGIGIDFDNICVFCGKFCVNSGKCVFIVVKTKYVNSGNMSDICGKLNFIISYTQLLQINSYFIKKHIQLQFLTLVIGRSHKTLEFSIKQKN